MRQGLWEGESKRFALCAQRDPDPQGKVESQQIVRANPLEGQGLSGKTSLLILSTADLRPLIRF
jgi:hypothetical protein